MVYRLVFSRDWPGISSCVCQHVSFIVRASIFIENCGRSQKRLGFYYFNLYHNQEFMKNELSSSMRVMRRKAKEGMCGFHVRVCVLKFSSFNLTFWQHIWIFIFHVFICVDCLTSSLKKPFPSESFNYIYILYFEII